MTLIAIVQVDTMVDGKRASFAPGSPLPDLHPHDVAQLKAMGAVEDPAETAASAKKAAAVEKVAGKEFAAARANVLAAADSTVVDSPAGDPDGGEGSATDRGQQAKTKK